MDSDSGSTDQIVEFNGVRLEERDATILKRIEDETQWKLHPKGEGPFPGDFIVEDHRVVALRLRSYRKSSFVEYVPELDGLRELMIKTDVLKELPPSFGKLKHLRELEVEAKLESLPDAMGELHSLEKLVLSWNELLRLPETIGNLDKLRVLDLEHNKLTHLPESFGNLKSLETLNVGDNLLENLGDRFGMLTSLKKLDLAGNNISQLNSGFGDLKGLEELILRFNILTSLPESFGNLTALKELNLWRNRLIKLPENICNLGNLRKLNVQENRLKELPTRIGDLRELKDLDLQNNRLTHLPDSLWDLLKLEHLNLGKNRLCEISESISGMSALRYLNISDNNQIMLPKGIEEMYSRGYFPVYFPDTARVIPPTLLFSKNRQLRTDVRRCFTDSLSIVENLEEYLEEWLSGNEKVHPYLLKLGPRLRRVLSNIRNSNPNSKDRLWALSEEIGKREEKSKVRIQFINLVEYSGSISYPMGLLYVSSHLKHNGFTNIEYLDHSCMKRELAKDKPGSMDNDHLIRSHEAEVERLISNLHDFGPNLILLGPVTTKFLVDLVDLVPEIRGHFPKAMILAGGPHFRMESPLHDELLENKCRELDGILVGEAEETVAEIAERFYAAWEGSALPPSPIDFRLELGSIEGVLIRDNSFTPRGPLELEDMPFPDMELLEEYLRNPKMPTRFPYSLSRRRNPLIGAYEGIVEDDSGSGTYSEDMRYFDRIMENYSRFPFGVVVGSRGCPYDCGFCCSPGPRRVHPARYVFDQMIELNERFGILLFSFFDPLFTTASRQEMRRIEELCDLLLKSNLNFRYIIEIRADIVLRLPEALLEKMISSGCVQYNLGIEKGSDESLKRIVKRSTTQDHYDAVAKLRKVAQKAGRPILVNGTFILGGPKETKTDILECLIHGFSLDLDEVDFYPLEIHPDTDVYNSAIEEEVVNPGLDQYLQAESYPVYATTDISRPYLDEVAQSCERTLYCLNDLKNTIRRLEQQIEHGDHRFFLTPEDHALGPTYGTVRRFIEEAMRYIRSNPHKRLFKDKKVAVPLEEFARHVEDDFQKLEKRLLSKFPDYEYTYGNYYMGSLSKSWESFLRRLDLLFTPERFK